MSSLFFDSRSRLLLLLVAIFIAGTSSSHAFGPYGRGVKEVRKREGRKDGRKLEDASVDPAEAERIVTYQTLDSKPIRALYSLVTHGMLESMYYGGRPAGKLYAYVFLESPQLAASVMSGTAMAKVTKDSLFAAAESIIKNPTKATEQLADAMMLRGLEAYRRNYKRYKVWKFTGRMDSATKVAFLEDSREQHYLSLGKQLWQDNLAFKHKTGKYKKVDYKFRDASKLLLEQLACLSDMSKEWSLAMTATRLKVLTDAAQDLVSDYPPYQDHLERLRTVEQLEGIKLPFARVAGERSEGESEKLVEGDQPSWLDEPAPVFKKPPPRPRMESVYKAIELGNAEEVWSHVYYKTGDINGGHRLWPWLNVAIVCEGDERSKRMTELVKKMAIANPVHGTKGPSAEQIMAYLNVNTKWEAIAKLYSQTRSRSYDAMITMLLENGADPARGFDRRTPLELAVNSQNMHAIAAVLSFCKKQGHFDNYREGCMVITKDVLDQAIRKKNPYIYKELLRYPHQVVCCSNRSLKEGESSLGCDWSLIHRAVDWGNAKILQYTIESFQDSRELKFHVNQFVRNYNNNATPLHVAAQKKDVAMVSMLLKAGADPNLSNKEGNTPLHFAAQNGSFGCVSSLLDHGAVRNVTNKEGKTPGDGANQNGYFLSAKALGQKCNPRSLLPSLSIVRISETERAGFKQVVLDAWVHSCLKETHFRKLPVAIFLSENNEDTLKIPFDNDLAVKYVKLETEFYHSMPHEYDAMTVELSPQILKTLRGWISEKQGLCAIVFDGEVRGVLNARGADMQSGNLQLIQISKEKVDAYQRILLALISNKSDR